MNNSDFASFHFNLRKVNEGIGEMTLADIIAELSKPGRDPREDMPKPILRQDVLKLEDLKEGMILSKTIKSPKTGTPLLTAGQQITSKTIEALKRYEIKTVDIELSSAEMKMFEMDNDVLPTIEQWIVDSAKQSITPIRHNGKLLLNVQDVIDNAERIKL